MASTNPSEVISSDETPDILVEKPSGPAQLINQPARSAFLLKIGETTIFSAAVKVRRDDALIPFKEAGARLFTLSRSDGWDTVHQSIRVAGIGLLGTDKLVLKGTVYGAGLILTNGVDLAPLGEQDETGCRGVCCTEADWMISVDDEATELAFKVKPEAVQLNAVAHEINLSYRPCVSDNISK